MIRPRVVSNPVVHRFIRVSGTLGAEFPDGPAIAVFLVEESDQAVEGVTVGSLGICL